MASYGRMIIATVIVIVMVVIAFMSYAIVSLPLEYSVDVLQDAYTDISEEMEWDDSDDLNDSLGAMPYFLAGGTVFLVILLFIWYFTYAHKKEYELD